MNDPTLICQDKQRRREIREQKLNGLDYLEVSDDLRRLTVYFLSQAPEGLVKENVRLQGGRRIRDVQVVDLKMCYQEDPERDDCMILTVNKPGDASTYTLCLVALDRDGQPTDRPFPGLDPRYACLKFSFRIGCPSDLDCKPQPVCPPEELDEPEISYLAKDYASFRRLILDRLALIMPDWQERHAPDLGIALVELLAYVGDYLSYYQDAVATEAYLDTARQRISVRRHTRLVDYPMHEGCNARAWVFVETDTDLALEPQAFYFITGQGLPLRDTVLTPDDLRNVRPDRYQVFEPLVQDPNELIQLYRAHSEIHFYTWGDRQCCLPRGATSATLADEWRVSIQEPEPQEYEPAGQRPESPEKIIVPPPAPLPPQRKLRLKAGDVLILQEIKGPQTGNPADADPRRCHAVRLTRVEPDNDPLYNRPVVEVEWAAEDALPFALCISTVGPAPECELLERISVARGNVVLVDHGQRIENEDLKDVRAVATEQRCEGEGRPTDIQIAPARFQPQLQRAPLTFSQPLPNDGPASQLLSQDPRQASPQITATGVRPTSSGDVVTRWTPQRDLLSSKSDDPHFVVEIDNAGRARLRFGDGELGRMPEAETRFAADYRVGNGPAGNVGARAISHLVLRRIKLSGVTLRPCNPMPAHGGAPPETMAEVKLLAPHACRTELQRAITAADYAALVERDFRDRVQRAAAALRWTGSGYEALVTVDPKDKMEADEALCNDIREKLGRYRRIGHDVVVEPAQYVPLYIELIVCVLPDYLCSHVKAALLDVFSNRALPDGRRGFFHPDNLSFGEGIYLSRLAAAAQTVPGVESVKVERLERLGEGPNGEKESGRLPLGPLEIARLDNDPNFPENGQLRLAMRGGR